jgi:hypothetical protein
MALPGSRGLSNIAASGADDRGGARHKGAKGEKDERGGTIEQTLESEKFG